MASTQTICVLCSELTDRHIAKDKDSSKVLLNFWKLMGFPVFELEHQKLIGVCELCIKRVDYLLSYVEKAKQLESEINEILNRVYRDLRKDLRAVVTTEDLQPVIVNREKAASSTQKFVCELRPAVESPAETVEVQPEDDVSLFSENQEIFHDDFVAADFGIPHFYLSALDPEVSEKKDAAVLACSYEDPNNKQQCHLTFTDRKIFDAHVASHLLRIHLSRDTVRNYMPTLLRSYWRNAPAKRFGRVFKCPHVDCVGTETERMFLSVFTEHLKESHSLYACPRAVVCLKGRVLFDSEQEMIEHVETDHIKKPKASRGEPFTEIHPVTTISETTVKCSGCPEPPRRNLMSRWEFCVHVIRQHGCYVCLRDAGNGACLHSFSSKISLSAHCEREHGLGPPGLDSADQTDLFLEPSLLYEQCSVCAQRGLASSALYVAHMRDQHGLLMCGLTLQKAFCQRVLVTETELKLHRAACRRAGRTTRKKYVVKCPCCQKKMRFPDRQAWVQHVRDDHKGLVCGISNNETGKFCEYMALSRMLMKNHVEKTHSSEIALGPTEDSESALQLYCDGRLDEVPGIPMDGPAVCQICSQSFLNFDHEWLQHTRSHGYLICDVQDENSSKPCLHAVSSAKGLRQHCYSVHVQRGKGPNYCDQCGQHFRYRSEYVKHLEKHSGIPPKCSSCGRPRLGKSNKRCTCSARFECDMCPKAFGNALGLSVHKLIHGKERVLCETCGQYHDPAARQRHSCEISTGFEGNGYSCSVCAKTFTTPGVMKDHFRRVHGPRNYKCYRCDWAFSTGPKLQVHIQKVHESIRPFICDVCGGTFKANGQLLDHLKKHESGLVKKQFKPRERRLKTPPPVDTNIALNDSG